MWSFVSPDLLDSSALFLPADSPASFKPIQKIDIARGSALTVLGHHLWSRMPQLQSGSPFACSITLGTLLNLSTCQCSHL
jgi:hypothetical protein